MKTFNEFLVESGAESILHNFWNAHKENLTKDLNSGYFYQNNCNMASTDLHDHISKIKPNAHNMRIIKPGSYDKSGNPSDGGFIRVDSPQSGKDDLHSSDIDEMRSKNLDPNKAAHRKSFVENHPEKEKFHWIPHSWVEGDSRELTGMYKKEPIKLDPSGFHPSGLGQFDKMIKDKENVKYKEYHKGKEV